MAKPCEHEDHVKGCRACELYSMSTHVRKRWDSRPKKEPMKPIRGVYPAVKCAKLGEVTGEKVICGSCPGRVALKIYSCAQFGTCTTNKAVEGVACCLGCPEFAESEGRGSMPFSALDAVRTQVGALNGGLKWIYGLTTVPKRRKDLLPRTLESLKAGGFPNPTLFVDRGEGDSLSWGEEFKLSATVRGSGVATIANWVLGMWEIYARNPFADRYAMFQDDFVCSKNLREYLEHCPFPRKGYLNLLTFPSNQDIAPVGGGWYEARTTNPDVTWQTGRGAVALVFDKVGVQDLLSHRDVVERPTCSKNPTNKLDGMIVTTMNKLGYREFVHSPSLVQHTGEVSSMGNPRHAKATSFRGEDFDLMGLLKK